MPVDAASAPLSAEQGCPWHVGAGQSRTREHAFRALSVPCEVCGSVTGAWCRHRDTLVPLKRPHLVRLRAAREMFCSCG